MTPDRIAVKNISKSFGEHVVFHNLSAEIPFAGVTVLRGASGAGKSTLFRLLLGLETPDSGDILGMRGRKPAVVFQEDRLLPWATALANVALVSTVDRAAGALVRLGLGDSLSQRPGELSGGMKRRVAIARALAYGGDMLFLDEPFTGLDDANKRIVSEALISERLPILVITHDDAEAELFGQYREIRIR